MDPTPVSYLSFSAEINQRTVETLLGMCSALVQAKAHTIHLLLSTSGGNIISGLTLYSVLRALPAKVITYNVANVDSIGVFAYLAAEERYTSPHSLFLLHNVSLDLPQGVHVEPIHLQDQLTSFDADRKRLADLLSERTGIPNDEANTLIGSSHILNAKEAIEKGIAQAITQPQAPPGTFFHQILIPR